MPNRTQKSDVVSMSVLDLQNEDNVNNKSQFFHKRGDNGVDNDDDNHQIEEQIFGMLSIMLPKLTTMSILFCFSSSTILSS